MRTGGMKVLIAIALWIGTAVGTFALLGAVESREGERARVPVRWPSGTELTARPGRKQLLLFIHPACPCSRATVRELERTLSDSPAGAADVWVVVYAPAEAPEDWTRTALVRDAAALPNARLVMDRDGRVRAGFGTQTSGHILLYDADGALMFDGGITASRGHEGANAAGDALKRCLDGSSQDDSRSAEVHAAVYGCPMETALACPPCADGERAGQCR